MEKAMQTIATDAVAKLAELYNVEPVEVMRAVLSGNEKVVADFAELMQVGVDVVAEMFA